MYAPPPSHSRLLCGEAALFWSARLLPGKTRGLKEKKRFHWLQPPAVRALLAEEFAYDISGHYFLLTKLLRASGDSGRV